MPTGSYRWAAYDAVETGWLVCDGSAVSRTTYADLFAKIGVTYGPGDASTTFNLPDGRGRDLRGSGTGKSGNALNTPPTGANLTALVTGRYGGEETHTQTIAETPAHTHGGGFGAGGVIGGGATGAEQDTDSRGGGNPFNVLDPYLTGTLFIKT
jgi:microcystin-dependent protein